MAWQGASMAQEHGRGVLATGKVNYFEWCRALGALAVLLLHTFIEMTNHVLPQLLVAGADAGAITCRIASYELIETLLTRWAVPVFLMISGALLLSPKKKMRPHYVWHYASRMIFVLAVFGTCYAAIKLHVEGVPLGLVLVAQALVLTLTARTWEHLWYLYALLGLYLLLPLLRLLVARAYRWQLLGVILALAVATMVVPAVLSLQKGELPSAGITVTQYLPSVVYFLLGYYVHTFLRWWKDRSGRILAVAGVASLAIACVASVSGVYIGAERGMFYLPFSPLTCLFSVAYFLWVRHALDSNDIREHRFFDCIARYSFGIYVLHVLFLHAAPRLVNLAALPAGVAEATVFVVALVGSLALTWLLRRIPIFRRYL